MNTTNRVFRATLLSLFCLLVCSCGVVKYPGQPGVVTNNYSKIDLEYLEQAGLFYYEVVYDNRPGGEGVGAVITKLYPKARTYTSNVRTNAEGTLYRAKGQYNGGEVQVISIPKLNQIHVSPQSKVEFLVEYDTSADEIDDRNIAEESIFARGASLTGKAWKRLSERLAILRAGSLNRKGNLSYEISQVKVGKELFVPSQTVSLETSLFQNSLQSQLSSEVKAEFREFIEKNFAKGYQGPVAFYLKGATQPLVFQLGIHTLSTAQAAGFKIIHNASNALAEKIVADFRNRIQ